MNTFEGTLDALEMSLLNATGVEHQTELMRDIQVIRRALEGVPMAPYQDICDRQNALLNIHLTVTPRPVAAGVVTCPACRADVDIFHGKRPSGERISLESHLSDARFTCRTCYEPFETKAFVLDVHKKERNGGDPS